MNGNVQQAIGNRDVHGRFPCGVYPAMSPGDVTTMEDRWVSLHVETDAQWQALGKAFGNPAWASDPRFSTNAAREEHYLEIDDHIAAFTAERDDYDLMRLLQGAGVACAPVLESSRMFDDPHLRARGFFRTQTQQDAGTHEYVGPLWQFEKTPVEFLQPPVMFGEHNDYVYRELLGLSEAEYDALKAAGHVATEYDPSVP